MGTLRTLLLIACAFRLAAQPTLGRDDRWREDIAALAGIIQQRHPDPVRNVSREQLATAFETLSAQVPTLADYQIVLGMNRALALMGDAHTALGAFGAAAGVRFFPLRLRHFAGGWYAVEANARLTAALGKRLLRIEGRPVEEIMEQVAKLIPHENDQWVLANAGNYLISPEVLHTLGVVADRNAAAAYNFEGGLTLTARIEGGTLFRYPRPGAPDPPLSQRNREYFYWFRWLEQEQLLYIKYDVCQQDPALPMAEMARQALAAVPAGGPLRFVIDLRDNTGGNSAVTLELLNTLGEAFATGRIQVRDAFGIIGRNTFSSGLLAALELRSSGVVQLLGETAGQPPNHFGDVFSFTLPNSRIGGQVSTREFRNPNIPGDLTPDIPVDYTIEDWAAQRDPYLDAILRRQ